MLTKEERIVVAKLRQSIVDDPSEANGLSGAMVELYEDIAGLRDTVNDLEKWKHDAIWCSKVNAERMDTLRNDLSESRNILLSITDGKAEAPRGDPGTQPGPEECMSSTDETPDRSWLGGLTEGERGDCEAWYQGRGGLAESQIAGLLALYRSLGEARNELAAHRAAFSNKVADALVADCVAKDIPAAIKSLQAERDAALAEVAALAEQAD